jgi:phosphoenolpyruvate synthase/pyruvate phosphate dikinase
MNRKSKQLIRLVTDFRNSRLIGEKSEGIKYLITNGYLVPLTYVCSSEAYVEYLYDNSHVIEILDEELRSKIDPSASYSVRPSATLEDNPIHLSARQFKTFSKVKGATQILESIRKIWESTKSSQVTSQSEKSLIRLDKPKMAVILQKTVEAEISGVAFTRNPMNGRDEVIIEAVDGFGSFLLQDRVDRYRGVYKWGKWVEKPNKGRAFIALLKVVAKKAKALERKRRTPLSLEWAYDGRSLNWLQLSEMANLSGLNFYSNRMAKEFLPGLIKPLVWSVNIPIVCGAWVRLLSELVSDLNISPQDLAKAFCYRAYFNMGIIGDVFEAFDMPREGLEVLMGYGGDAPEKPSFKPGPKLLKHLPRLLLFVLDKAFFGRKMRKFIQINDQALEEICAGNLEAMDASDTIRIIEKLHKYNEQAAYFVIVSQLLNAVYNRILMGQLGKKGRKLEDLDLGRAEYRDIDPNWGILKLHQEYVELPKTTQQTLASLLRDQEGLEDNADINRFKRSFEDFMYKFGHLSDQGNDFSNVPWREQPELVLDLVVSHTKLEDPYTTKEGRDKPLGESSFLLNWACQKARESLEYKERISFNYTKSYGLFRNYFLHLAELFKAEGYIPDLEDIFYFTLDEIEGIVNEGRLSSELSQKLDERKREIAEYKDVELPEVIYGDEAPTPMRKESKFRVLSGIPASGGYYTGITCVVKGAQDFSKVSEGVVLVIPFSDVSWTPIFTKAGAVISESGGLLSHSAIIAREYSIPSIVGVNGACDLGDGRKVSVDGFSGRITIQ